MALRLSILFLFFFTLSYAQREVADVWYFGNHNGIDFRDSRPRPLIDSHMEATEGCTSICDFKGRFLFYTNGVKVWNANHEVMPNGKNLKGHDSSTQSALAFQKPGDINTYYLFTADAGAYDSPPNNGIYYNVISMLKEDGLGDVVEKNKFLYSPAAEKLTAVQHHNGADVWVLTHAWNSNEFRVFLVTKDGVQTKPVVSRTGSAHTGGNSFEANSIGYMKCSPNGRNLAVVQYEQPYVELFDFNDATGEVTNPRVIFYPDKTWCYGLEFSPDNQLLYVNEYVKLKVLQFDITLSTQSKITESVQVVGNSKYPKLAAMQLANDGKIYVIHKSRYLGVINSPNVKGMGCSYVDDQFFLGSKKPKLGLPNYMCSYFKVL